jgi:PPM family protein phosphatase
VQALPAALTDLGLRRPANEDSYVCRPELGLYAVCDGMGGHAAGEIASRAAADSIESFIQHTNGVGEDYTWPFKYQRDRGVDGNRLVFALLMANREIGQRIADDPALRGMATTAVCLLLAKPPWSSRVVPSARFAQDDTGSEPAALLGLVAHVGDSRAYLWHDGALDQITRDHSWVEEQIASGVLDEEEARRHPWRNLVTRALAGAEDPIVDLTPIALEPGDRILLCSDGLTSPLTSDAIAEIVARTPAGQPEELCRGLVGAANDAGGPDNITVIVVEIK